MQVKQHFKVKCRRGIIYLIANITTTSARSVKTWKHAFVPQHPTVAAGNDMVLAKCLAVVWALWTEANHFYFVLVPFKFKHLLALGKKVCLKGKMISDIQKMLKCTIFFQYA